MQLGSARKHRWGVILAGGEGVRLRSLTRFVSGEETPKQFCPLLGGRTLLSQTKQRLARNISPDRTMFVLLNSHERFYSKELGGVSPTQFIVQPSNRGTLPAILSSLIHILHRDKDAVVGFFPSDHHYSEEDRFVCGVDLAFSAAEANPESVMLLGVAAKHPETDYGWIEAQPAVSSDSEAGFLKVKRFWEKPSARTAQDLMERGCVWNTFVMIGRAQAFLDIIKFGAPEVFDVFKPLMEEHDAQEDSLDLGIMNSIYERLSSTDFSRVVLSAATDRLGVWCLGDVGWSDLGDPRRVITMLSETGSANEWMTSWHERGAPVMGHELALGLTNSSAS